ncbi:MAG: UDP-N-acetylmuramoyl-L-alanyl-D-glutamate--2,6-diaminopimelate ligase, partial [Sphingobacteriia bacterium]|nr:UDP-N-acetylmuramoyl-L-alanyl-D-glutamate--2,6-diaminopimelate ligase [Sphingobacteriia bacterium]
KIKNIYHLLQAVLANIRFGFPSRKLKVIGVTGTNGKTTTVQMVTKILEEAGFGVAMASTINFKLGEEEWVNKTKFTTLSPWKVQGFIKKAIDKKCDYLVLETSSHSLDQYRVWGVDYDLAVITNVTREHLDYHKTMKIYREAKLRLFRKARKLVVNLDMENPEDFYDFPNKEMIYGYTLEDNEVENEEIEVIQAREIKNFNQFSQFKVRDTEYILNLPGRFNIENALAAISIGIIYGVKAEKIKIALEKIKNISGRMEYVPNNRGLNIIIDYAVTPDSLKKLYTLIREVNTENKRIIAVFGSCGERDRGKRPIMGEIVARKADFVIVTNEDPYREEPVQIINEVFAGIVGEDVDNLSKNLQFKIFPPATVEHLRSGNLQSISNGKIRNKMKKEGENAWRILERREAIRFALGIAQSGDFVIVTGKGAEETMAIGDKRIPWNDKQVILEELNT